MHLHLLNVFPLRLHLYVALTLSDENLITVLLVDLGLALIETLLIVQSK